MLLTDGEEKGQNNLLKLESGFPWVVGKGEEWGTVCNYYLSYKSYEKMIWLLKLCACETFVKIKE